MLCANMPTPTRGLKRCLAYWIKFNHTHTSLVQAEKHTMQTVVDRHTAKYYTVVHMNIIWSRTSSLIENYGYSEQHPMSQK